MKAAAYMRYHEIRILFSESVQLLTAAHFWWLPQLPIQQKRCPPTGKSATRSLLESHTSLGACFGVSRYFLVFKGWGSTLIFLLGSFFFGGKPNKIMGFIWTLILFLSETITYISSFLLVVSESQGLDDSKGSQRVGSTQLER